MRCVDVGRKLSLFPIDSTDKYLVRNDFAVNCLTIKTSIELFERWTYVAGLGWEISFDVFHHLPSSDRPFMIVGQRLMHGSYLGGLHFAFTHLTFYETGDL